MTVGGRNLRTTPCRRVDHPHRRVAGGVEITEHRHQRITGQVREVDILGGAGSEELKLQSKEPLIQILGDRLKVEVTQSGKVGKFHRDPPQARSTLTWGDGVEAKGLEPSNLLTARVALWAISTDPRDKFGPRRWVL